MYFAAGALARKVEKMAVECWKPVNLSPSHAYLLLLVIENPGVQPSQLCSHLQLTPSTITRLMEKLEEKKLVTRKTEGKNTIVYPTKEALQLLPKMRACQDEFAQKQSSIIQQTDSCELIQRINKLSEAIDE
jgi:DNA-binding MarR family transcriptional regulator